MGGLQFVGSQGSMADSMPFPPPYHLGLSDPHRLILIQADASPSESRRYLDRILGDRLAGIAVSTMGQETTAWKKSLTREERPTTRTTDKCWTENEKSLLKKMIGLFESGDPKFAARHDDIYGSSE